MFVTVVSGGVKVRSEKGPAGVSAAQGEGVRALRVHIVFCTGIYHWRRQC